MGKGNNDGGALSTVQVQIRIQPSVLSCQHLGDGGMTCSCLCVTQHGFTCLWGGRLISTEEH